MSGRTLGLWTGYVSQRLREVPDDMQIMPKVKQSMWAVFNAYKKRNSSRVEGTVLLDFLKEYVKIHRFNLAIDPEILLRQIHPFHGHLTKLNDAVAFDEFYFFLEYLILASFEKLQGQTLLAAEICAYAYWRFRDQGEKGYLDFHRAKPLLKSFDWEFEDWEAFKREFTFALEQPGNADQLLWTENSVHPDSVLTFDLFRYIYLERNL